MKSSSSSGTDLQQSYHYKHINSYSATHDNWCTVTLLKQDNDSTVRGDGGSRGGEVRAGTTSPMPEHKGFKLQ